MRGIGTLEGWPGPAQKEINVSHKAKPMYYRPTPWYHGQRLRLVASVLRSLITYGTYRPVFTPRLGPIRGIPSSCICRPNPN